MFDSFPMMPSQVALILGVQQRDIWEEIMDGQLHANREGKKLHTISVNNLVQYLHEHPENVGRVYCDDIPGFITMIRQHIVNRLEDLNNVQY